MKKLIILLQTLFLTASVFALPGFFQVIPDASGEFVYYKDNSFDRESYIGFLTYDENNYMLRYFAPEISEKNLPAKEVSLLLSIDSTKNHMELTGERFITLDYANPEDTDIVNYLHDLMYEFNSRRIKAEPILDYDTTVRKQDYAQFGGDVSIYFDNSIPLFNIQKIKDNKGEDVFYVVTTGAILSSDDTTFTDFRGFTSYIQADRKPVEIKSAAKKTFTPDENNSNIKITLDENWTQALNFAWTLGDSAVLNLATSPYSEEDAESYLTTWKRRCCRSINHNYVDFSSVVVKKSSKGFSISCDKFDTESNNFIHSSNVFTQKKFQDKDLYIISILNVFNTDWKTNSRYFKNLKLAE